MARHRLPLTHWQGLATLALALLGLGAACNSGGGGSTVTTTASTVTITNPGLQVLNEDSVMDLPILVQGGQGTVRVSVAGLPPGACWDSATQRLRFKPDFIQGGATWTVTVTASDDAGSVAESFSVQVQDTLAPPTPTVTATVPGSTYDLLTVSQVTDSYLDSPGYAATRSFEARVVVQKNATANNRMPVRVYLHGLGGSPDPNGRTGEFAISPHDPMNSYWWGYATNLPGGIATSGSVPNYTQRRVLNLLEWLLRTYPGADPDRVYVVGGSMGGAGAATLGLLYARHFCYVYSTIGQMIPRKHRPYRLSRLGILWGSPAQNLDDGTGMGVWDRMDLTRALRDDHEARQQFLFTKHGKDDPTIHFGAVVFQSPLTGSSYYQAVQAERIGHYAVWDEGGHGTNAQNADPVLGTYWWHSNLSLVFDAETYLRRNLAFPAFSQSTLDDDPGTGQPNGRQSWDDTSGYAGSLSVAGDTGWDGVIAGARNRHLRWRSSGIVDLPERFEIPLCVFSGTGGAAPSAGYPTTGNLVAGTLPAQVHVTVRRTQRFRPQPGQPVSWSFGALSGTASADQDGVVTVPNLPLTSAWTRLVLEQ
ncbi:hypothetical protein ACFL59_04740 [Planctomycetota bacterium]